MSGSCEVLDPDQGGAEVQSGKVTLGGLVEAGGDAAPCLQLVDQALDGVAFLVELGIVGDGPTAPAALLLPVGGLVLLLWDDYLDVAFAQVGAVGSGGVRLVSGDRVRPGAGTADRETDPYLVQHGDELRAVGGLPRGERKDERPALAVGGDVDLAGLPTPRTPQQGGLQTEFAASPDASAFGFDVGLLPDLSLAAAPFDRAFLSSAASSRASRSSG